MVKPVSSSDKSHQYQPPIGSNVSTMGKLKMHHTITSNPKKGIKDQSVKIKPQEAKRQNLKNTAATIGGSSFPLSVRNKMY